MTKKRSLAEMSKDEGKPSPSFFDQIKAAADKPSNGKRKKTTPVVSEEDTTGKPKKGLIT